jgi:hypothetical protein
MKLGRSHLFGSTGMKTGATTGYERVRVAVPISVGYTAWYR